MEPQFEFIKKKGGITTQCDALLTEEANQPVSIVIDTGISISSFIPD